MIYGERELLTEPAQPNRDMESLCMRIIDRSTSIAEQRAYAERLSTAGERLRRRTINETTGVVIHSEVLANSAHNLPMRTVQPALEQRR